MAVDAKYIEKTALRIFNFSRENIDEALKKLKSALGDEWATNAPVILIAYARDFTPTPGRRPHIVCLPATTEELQSVVKIANEHKLPVMTLTTGFNHGGCCLPRWGGIMVDLKRMDKIIEVDEESMTITFQPHVRIAAIYAEANKRFSIDNIKLRPANPITMGSVSMLSNYISGGASHMAYKSGNHHENIVSMKWVLPDGEILITGSKAYKTRGTVPVLGPGPDIGGMFLAAEGNFGICTEITIKLFNEMPSEKIYMIIPKDEKPETKYDMEPLCDFYYKVSRENILHDIYKSHNRAFAAYAGPNSEDYIPTAPFHNISATITGISDEEVQIKHERFMEILNDSAYEPVPDFVLETMFSAFGFTVEEAKKVMFKRCYSITKGMRWRGSFQWVAFPVKFNKIPELERVFRNIVKRHWTDYDPAKGFELSPFGVSLQGPFPLGRFIALEFDFFVDHGNPEDIKKFNVVFRKTIEEMIKRGAMVGRVVPFSHEIMYPYLGKYVDLVKRLKKEMDPIGIFAPDVMPITEEYI